MKIKETEDEEIKDLSEKLSNLLFHGNTNGKKNTIPITYLSFCLRKAAFNLYFGTRSFERYPKAALGEMLHLGFQKLIENNARYIFQEDSKFEFEVPLEYELENGWKITGRADFTWNNKVIELKFKDFDRFSGIDLDEIPDDEVLKAYIEQVNAYAFILDKEPYIWVFDNREMKFKILEVEKDEEQFYKMIQKAHKIIDGVEQLREGKFPIELKQRFSWECNYCIYRAICNALK